MADKVITAPQLGDALDRISDYFVLTNQDFSGASALAAGAKGMVPAPSAGDNTKFLRGDGTWQAAGGGGSVSFDLRPGSGGRGPIEPLVAVRVAGSHGKDGLLPFVYRNAFGLRGNCRFGNDRQGHDVRILSSGAVLGIAAVLVSVQFGFGGEFVGGGFSA